MKSSSSSSKSQQEQQQDEPRITELPNEMSLNIDIASPTQIIRILRQCDSQIYGGWHEHGNIYDYTHVISVIVVHCMYYLQQNFNNKNTNKVNKIVLTGCGTSGRLGYLTARLFNEYLESINEKACFDYCIAGGDKALLTSQELPEDDPIAGVKDLKEATNDATNVVLIGITCGLSAPYVGGQIEYSMKQENWVSILLGFNPTRLARS